MPRITLSRPHRHTPLALWHLASLDAPTVAVTWAWAIARAAHLKLPGLELLAIALAVWILYAADRLLDARRFTALEERHYFHRHHRRSFLAIMLAAAAALALCVIRFPTVELRIYLVLGAMLLVWLALVHTRFARGIRLPKELAVGFFFAAAVFIPTVARMPALRPALLIPAILVAALSALNTLFIYRWEHPFTGAAHATTRFALERLRALASLTLAVALAGFVLLTLASLGRANVLPSTVSTLALAAALSAATLLLLDRYRRRFSPVHLRALADAALLMPLLTTLLR